MASPLLLQPASAVVSVLPKTDDSWFVSSAVVTAVLYAGDHAAQLTSRSSASCVFVQLLLSQSAAHHRALQPAELSCVSYVPKTKLYHIQREYVRHSDNSTWQ